MIISRTPFRISFFGGGTDYPAWYLKHGGAVLATSINKYCYLTVRYLPPFFEHRFRVVYSKIEDCLSVDEIQHPTARAILKYLEIDRGVEIHHDGDLPARSGMGSSSSFSVGLLHALYALKGRMPGKHKLAMDAICVEQEHTDETVGSQDQVAAAYGGFNHVIFDADGEITVRPMTLTRERTEELSRNLMLFYTGIRRIASEVARTYVEEIEDRAEQLTSFGRLVDEGVSLLSSDRDVRDFGELLDEAWQIKRTLSRDVSNPEVEGLYNAAREAGAVGGKILGAGGGGFLLLFVPPEKQKDVLVRFDNLIHVPFEFETNGSQIIFFGREEDHASQEMVRSGQILKPFRELDPADK